MYKKYLHMSNPVNEGYKLQIMDNVSDWTMILGFGLFLLSPLFASNVPVALGTFFTGSVLGIGGGVLHIIKELILKCTESNIEKVFQNPEIHKYMVEKLKYAEKEIKATVKKKVKGKVTFHYTEPMGGFDDDDSIYIKDKDFPRGGPDPYSEGYNWMTIKIDDKEIRVCRDNDSIPEVRFVMYAVHENISGIIKTYCVFKIAPPPKSLIEKILKPSK